MTQNVRRLMALALFVLGLHAATLAQDYVSHRVRAQIPFSFYAGDKALPAGNYTLAVNRANNTTAIYRSDGASGMFLPGSPYDGSRNGVTLLTFRMNQEGVYVLQKLQGPDVGLSFSTGKALSGLAKSGGDGATQIVIAELVK